MTVTPTARPASADTEWPTEKLLASRPRVRRDILYAQVPEGVLFHDASTGFRVHGRTAYRFATLVVPFLDGRITVAEICAGLGEPQRAMVEDLVRTLYRRRFARPVPPVDPDRQPALPDEVRARFEAQIAYVDHHVDGADERFARFRSTRVAVLGGDPIARWAVLSLLRNGVATVGAAPELLDRCADVGDEADGLRAEGCHVDLRRDPALAGAPTWADLGEYDVVVVTPDEQGMRHVLGLLEAGVPTGRTLLPAWQVGTSVVVGPSVGPDVASSVAPGGGPGVGPAAGCWMCAALRLAANTDAGAAADL